MGLSSLLFGFFTMRVWLDPDINGAAIIARVLRVVGVINAFFIGLFTMDAWWQVFVLVLVVWVGLTKLLHHLQQSNE